jgi:type I restriction enzyme, S subunit
METELCSDPPADWEVRSIEEVCARVTSGGTPSRREAAFYVDGIWPWVKTQELQDTWIDDTDEHITADAVSASSAKVLPVNTVLVAMYGATVGQLGLLRRPMTCNQACSALVVDQKAADYRFVFYQLLQARSELRRLATGAAQQNLSGVLIKSLRFPYPAVPEQRAVAHILSTLDDKIELNRRMNETLDAMARSLFKSWFVDFDPVRAKADGGDPGLPQATADLFPDRFDRSELGPIPSGWSVVSINDLARRIAIGPFGSDITTDNFVSLGVPVVRGSNLTNGFVEDTFVFLTEEKANQLRNANAFPGDVVITHRGTLGQVGLIPKQSRFPRYVISQSQMLISVAPEVAPPQYVYEFLRSHSGQQSLLANTSQTGVPAIARPTSSLRAMRVCLPPIGLLTLFDKHVGSWRIRCDHNTSESRLLTALRALLLPKLISGELRVRTDDASLKVTA